MAVPFTGMKCNVLVEEELGKKGSKLDVRVEMFHEKSKSIQ